MRKLITLFTLATAAKKPPPKRVALVSFAAPWDYGPYAHQLRELAEHWLSTHHVVWIGLSGTVDRIQYGAPKISPLVGYRGAGMSKDPVKKVSKLNRIFVLTQRLQNFNIMKTASVPRRRRRRSTSRSRSAT